MVMVVIEDMMIIGDDREVEVVIGIVGSVMVIGDADRSLVMRDRIRVVSRGLIRRDEVCRPVEISRRRVRDRDRGRRMREVSRLEMLMAINRHLGELNEFFFLLELKLSFEFANVMTCICYS